MKCIKGYYFKNEYGFFLGILILIFIPLSGISQDFGRNKRPNFLVILTDDQTYRAMGYNNKLVVTPNLDKLASKGMIFDNCYAATPICVASRASFLTGVYPETNGTVSLNTESFIENIVKRKKFKTLPQYLAELGYTTYFSGKSHLGNPLDYGFQYGVETFEYDDKIAFKNAISLIQDKSFGSSPFFFWLSPRQPHIPLKPEKEWLQLYNSKEFPVEPNFLTQPPQESFYNQGFRGSSQYLNSNYYDNYKGLSAGPPRSAEQIKEFTKAYYATISHLDNQIGQVLDELKKKSLLDNTVIIFLSDNGYLLGNHGLGNKITMQEESTKVPMFIYWKNLKNSHTRTRALVSSLDIFPTILELAGITVPNHLHGTSLKPVFANPLTELHKYIISESTGVDERIDESGKWQWLNGDLGTGHRSVISENWKYILSDIGDQALYNLEKDPYELQNVIDDSKNDLKIKQMKTFLKEWKKLTGDKKDIPENNEEFVY